MIGKRILPWKNPIEYPSRSLRVSEMKGAGSSGFNFGGVSVTTTDTTQFITITNTTVTTTTNQALIIIPTQITFKHSANNARIGMALYLYRDPNGGTSSGFVNPTLIGSPDGVILAAQNEWYVFNFVGGYYLSDFVPGTHALYIAMRNYTTGTLTAIQPNNDFLTAFTVGI